MDELIRGDGEFLKGIGAGELENPGFKAAQERADSIIGACHFDKAIEVINGLISEVKESSLSSRFSETRGVMKQGAVQRTGVVPNPTLGSGLSEADYKRGELNIRLTQIRAELDNTNAKLKNLILDFEASKREF